MRIKLAKTAGFCPGVRRAMNLILEAANKEKGPLYTYGPLIHNPQAIEMLASKGVRVIDTHGDLPGGEDGAYIIIRSHGVTPDERRRIRGSGARVGDATCPRVSRVQAIIKKHVRQGYTPIIIGDRGHSEVTGLLGYAGTGGLVVEKLEDVAGLPEAEKVCVVAQTTQEKQAFWEIARAIKERYPKALIFHTICDATGRRQEETRSLAEETDAMIVVGGRNSANTRRLAQICRDTGTLTYHVEMVEELDIKDLEQYGTVGVTAGASTPNWLIQQVVDRLEALHGEKRRKWLRFLWDQVTYLLKSNVYVGLGAASLSYATCRLQGVQAELRFALATGFYVFSMHILNHFTDWTAVKFSEPARLEFYGRHKKLLIILGGLSALGALICALSLGLWPFLLILAMSILGVVYRIRILPIKWPGPLGYHSLKDIPASKDLALALAWTIVAVITPILAARSPFTAATGVALFFTFSMAFIRSVLFSIKEIQGDQIVGRETIPILAGIKNTKAILVGLTALLAVVLIISQPLGWTDSLSLLLLIGVLYTALYLYLYHRRLINQGTGFELMVDGVFYLCGFLAYLYHLLG
ncbi:4-hydroxy-3-methylbut-2-enyl diphosphate reductase [Candidatus Zixiibacteriota bacterium]